MSEEATAERIDPGPDRHLAALRWPLAGGALLVLALLSCLSLWSASAQASFPGANGKIFCEGLNDRESGTGDLEIISVNADGSAYTLVTNNGPLVDPAIGTAFLVDQNPAVSPNGRRVAWSTNRDGGSRIYVKNADGTGPETVLTTEGVARVHSWSPDGSQIYFNNNLGGFPGNNEVYRMNADGSSQTNLTNRGTSDVAPAVKPDGTRVLFHSNRNLSSNDFDIHSMNPDGTDVTNLTNNPAGNDLDANWKPDGTQIVFERFASGSNSNIFKMNADGSGVTQLTAQPTGLNRNPVWSPDGTRIAFDSGRGTATGQPNNQEVYTMNPDGSDVRRVTNSLGADGFCDWQAIPRPAARRPVLPPRVYYPGPTPPAAKLNTRLTLTAKPRRDRRLPFKYRFSGRVRIPAGVSKAAVCGGRVKLRLKKGSKTVAKGTAKVSSGCTYRRTFTIRNTRRTGRRKGKLKVAAAFGGNARLKPSKRSTTVRFF